MVVEEGPPRLRRPSLPALLPMTADRLRTDLETQTAQLALDAFRPPVAVLSSHKDDELPELIRHARAARPAATPEGPVALPADAMPAHDGSWLDDHRRLTPARPRACKE